MKSAMRRALSMADEIESFRWSGLPDDADGIFFSVQHLRGLAIRFRACTQSLNQSRLKDALDKLPVSIDCNDLDGGLVLHAELLSIVGLLRDAVEEWGDDPSQWRFDRGAFKNTMPQLDATSLKTKERESLLKLVIGMAVGAYAYNPSNTKSGVPQEIADDLERAGLRLDVDTVRKYLQQGSVFLPPLSSDEA